MRAARARVPAWPAPRACTRADAPAAATSRRCPYAAPAAAHAPPGNAPVRATAPAAAEPATSQLGFPVPGLEDLLDAGQERRRVGAVDGAVVPCQRQIAHRVHDDGVAAVGQLNDNRPLLHT